MKIEELIQLEQKATKDWRLERFRTGVGLGHNGHAVRVINADGEEVANWAGSATEITKYDHGGEAERYYREVFKNSKHHIVFKSGEPFPFCDDALCQVAARNHFTALLRVAKAAKDYRAKLEQIPGRDSRAPVVAVSFAEKELDAALSALESQP